MAKLIPISTYFRQCPSCGWAFYGVEQREKDSCPQLCGYMGEGRKLPVPDVLKLLNLHFSGHGPKTDLWNK